MTKGWFESIPKAWNSDPDKVKSMADVRESILWVADDLPLARIPDELVKEAFETGLMDQEIWQKMKRENKSRTILKIRDGFIEEFRAAMPNDKPTATMSGKYAAFEKLVKREEDITWLILEGEIRFKGPFPRFARRMDQYDKLIETIINNTELPT